MNADRKKEHELKCFKKVLNYHKNKGQFAIQMYKLFLECKENIILPEKPDIIISSDNKLIGIEHCQTDLFFKIKSHKAQSMLRNQQSTMERKVDEYKDLKIREEAINNGKAIDDILELVNERIDHKTNFDYSKFIDNFKRVCSEHNTKTSTYHEHLIEKAKGKDISLGCLVEIPFLKEKAYIVTKSNKQFKIAINGIPITDDMVNVIKNMQDFDFVILCLNCSDVESKAKDTVCYYFNPNRVNECLKQQGITLYDSFDLVKLPPYRVYYDKNNYQINAKLK